MDVIVRRIDDGYRFEGSSDRKISVLMDNSIDSGGKGEAPSPLQVLLITLGGCSGIDVVSILEKSRQQIDSMEIELHADREKKGFISPFKHVHAHFKFSGSIDEDKAIRAIRLSLEKYCTVSDMLKATVELTASLSLNAAEKVDISLSL